MCLAVPVCVTELPCEGMARARVGDSDTFVEVSTMLLENEPQPGDYLITHAGFALRSLDPAEAQESLKLLRELATTGEMCRFA